MLACVLSFVCLYMVASLDSISNELCLIEQRGSPADSDASTAAASLLTLTSLQSSLDALARTVASTPALFDLAPTLDTTRHKCATLHHRYASHVKRIVRTESIGNGEMDDAIEMEEHIPIDSRQSIASPPASPTLHAHTHYANETSATQANAQGPSSPLSASSPSVLASIAPSRAAAPQYHITRWGEVRPLNDSVDAASERVRPMSKAKQAERIRVDRERERKWVHMVKK